MRRALGGNWRKGGLIWNAFYKNSKCGHAQSFRDAGLTAFDWQIDSPIPFVINTGQQRRRAGHVLATKTGTERDPRLPFGAPGAQNQALLIAVHYAVGPCFTAAGAVATLAAASPGVRGLWFRPRLGIHFAVGPVLLDCLVLVWMVWLLVWMISSFFLYRGCWPETGSLHSF